MQINIAKSQAAEAMTLLSGGHAALFNNLQTGVCTNDLEDPVSKKLEDI
jgi:hypothetical protein